MEKVILITSREIDSCVCHHNHLDYSEEYRKSFLEGSGIIERISDNKYLNDSYNRINKTIDEIAKLISADKAEGFVPGVFKFTLNQDIVYLAREYPHFDQPIKHRYVYLNGLFDMIDSDLPDKRNLELLVYSHDRDWGYQHGQLQANQIGRIIERCNKFDLVYLKKYVEKSEVFLFEHKHEDKYYVIVKNIINELQKL